MPKINYYDQVSLRFTNSNVQDEDADFTIQIVPAYEADSSLGRVSVEAPIGKAVIHRRQGDLVTYKAAGTARSLLIVAVHKHLPPRKIRLARSA